MLLEALLPRDLLKELNDTHAETLGPAGPLNGGASVRACVRTCQGGAGGKGYGLQMGGGEHHTPWEHHTHCQGSGRVRCGTLRCGCVALRCGCVAAALPCVAVRCGAA